MDFNTRIAQVWIAFNKLRSILKAPRPTVQFKMQLFNSTCVSVILYGCQTWVLTEALIIKLDIFATTSKRIIILKGASDILMPLISK